ncbi:PadR family transcriptional regulator [Amycolatopsis anabasis]|uniref:PadR family transcriptional regulator n=1 Tax=Amycolatopsis anabasis TaxID=1840409 RepID=UPI00131BCB4C|nr:helix-turn-helix transcriptional regulator [Amycolatopsis anabasis]
MAAAKLTPLGIAVLELLHEHPMHPYEMAQLMRERYVNNRVKLKAGSLYHTVERLAARGFIEVVDTQREGRRPERTVYAMTEAGKDAFTERAKDMVGMLAEEYPEFLSGLAVLDELGSETALRELREREIRLASAVASDEIITAKLHAEHTPEIYWLDWRFKSAQRKFELEWTRELIADLESGRVAFLRERGEKPELNLIHPRGNDDHRAG